MDINSIEFAQLLDETIEKKVNKIVNETLNNKFGIMKGWSGKVSNINSDGTVDVIIVGQKNPITNLKNKSGQILNISDEVFLYSISSLSNAYVGTVKK